MKRFVHFVISLAFFISSCSATPQNYVALETRAIEVMHAQLVSIQVDYGEVKILQSDDSQLHVEGQVLFPDELDYQIHTAEKQISVDMFTHHAHSSKAPALVIVRVPQGSQIKLESDTASIIAQEYQGNLEVDSISGDVTLQGIVGKMILHSNRGNITVQNSLGVLSIVGNYGALTTHDVHGETAMSTIMGNIIFAGSIAEDDTVRLEADHGSVSVNLSADSALALQVNSTSGDVTCMLPDVTASTRTCDGVMHSGGGSLSVRTVSGAVTLQLIP
ncbi:MAG: DUF4097 family beta strand repeat-containing protein [Chloroflexota bacterium]